jgi:DtxR family Mn-dependent transcriptional regulator
MDLSRTQQDYIKVIWKMEKTGRTVKIRDVAHTLKVKPPTVSSMFKLLDNQNIIAYDKKNGARLTTKGRREAEQLIRKHRLIETFLQQVLNLEEPLLHDEAEKLEHVISDKLIMRIDEFLNYPNIDPHGSVIPFSETDELIYALCEIEPHISFRVLNIPMTGSEHFFCAKNDFLPGSQWEIIQIGPQEKTFLVSNGKDFLAISDHMAEKISVSIVRE